MGVVNTTNRCSSLESVSVFHELSLGTTHCLYFSRPSVDNPLNARKSPSSFSAPDGKVTAKSNLCTTTPAFNHRANNRTRNLRIILRERRNNTPELKLETLSKWRKRTPFTKQSWYKLGAIALVSAYLALSLHPKVLQKCYCNLPWFLKSSLKTMWHFFLSWGKGGGGSRSITRIAKMMNPVFFMLSVFASNQPKAARFFLFLIWPTKIRARLSPFAKSKNSLKPRQQDFT